MAFRSWRKWAQNSSVFLPFWGISRRIIWGDLTQHHCFPPGSFNTWFINRQVNQAYKNDELINHLQQKLLIWNMYLCIKHELFSAASTPTQPKGPLSIDQNTNAFHPQKAQQRIGNQQTPCKCSWPKQFVTLSFDWMAVFSCGFTLGNWRFGGCWSVRVLKVISGSRIWEEFPKPMNQPIVTSWKVHLHQFQFNASRQGPHVLELHVFFRKFWGRVPLSWTIPLEK